MAESTWRSNVIACDGGIGTMQIMPGTADFVHMRFKSSFDVQTLDGNTAIGAAYLQWLTVYFGIFYFGASFDLDATAPVGADGATVVLRDAVIAGYNVGHRGVENEHDTPDDPSDDTLEIPNQWYVDRVNGYIADCPCDEF
jgi:soluble lytic murein transglycosylase-like protein